jgi:hypothetical protein
VLLYVTVESYEGGRFEAVLSRHAHVDGEITFDIFSTVDRLDYESLQRKDTAAARDAAAVTPGARSLESGQPVCRGTGRHLPDQPNYERAFWARIRPLRSPVVGEKSNHQRGRFC